jgi:hypothetical protein
MTVAEHPSIRRTVLCAIVRTMVRRFPRTLHVSAAKTCNMDESTHVSTIFGLWKMLNLLHKSITANSSPQMIWERYLPLRSWCLGNDGWVLVNEFDQ